MEEVRLTVSVGPMARRVILTNGGSIKPFKNTKREVVFPATKVWRFPGTVEYLVGWNVLILVKSKTTLRCRHPKLLSVRQLDEIDNLILPRLKDEHGPEEMVEDGSAGTG